MRLGKRAARCVLSEHSREAGRGSMASLPMIGVFKPLMIPCKILKTEKELPFQRKRQERTLDSFN